MITTAIAIGLALVLFVLGAIHVRWAIRNRFEGSVVIPQVNGRFVFIPSRTASATVALALFVGAALALAQGHVIDLGAPALMPWLAYAAGAAFCLRAIGDFRLVGFFKRVHGTAFARWDTRLFAPLSALIGLSYIYLASR